jgi:hypothetical protein
MTKKLLLTLLLLAPGAAASALDETEFARLYKQLQPPAEEGWSSIPWKTSLVQACVQAARERKPLFMVCRAGHPLGCV